MGLCFELFYLFFLALLSGNIIHEYGHALTLRIFDIKITKIEFHIFSKSRLEHEEINNKNIQVLSGLSGGFLACLFLWVILLIFPLNSVVSIGSFQLTVTELGLFFCFNYLISGIVEGFFYDFYINNRLSQTYIDIFCLVVYYLYYLFF